MIETQEVLGQLRGMVATTRAPDRETRRGIGRALRARYGWRWWRLDRYKVTAFTPAVRGHRPRVGRARLRSVLITGPGLNQRWTRRRLAAGRRCALVNPPTQPVIERQWVGPYEEEYAGRVWAGWWRERIVRGRQARGVPRLKLLFGNYRAHPLQRGSDR